MYGIQNSDVMMMVAASQNNSFVSDAFMRNPLLVSYKLALNLFFRKYAQTLPIVSYLILSEAAPMRKQRHKRYTNCPVEAALDIIGGKWKSIILFRVMEETRRFTDIRKLLPNITQRTLTNQLRELESDGLVKRKIYPEIPPKVEYSITNFGRTLEPVLLALKTWAEIQMPDKMNKEPE